jgi:stage V sporulation protein R
MESFINPEEYLEEQKKKTEASREKSKKFPERSERDVLRFLLDFAPLERWERDVLEVIREEALYFVPQMQTKIMNEGWATYWHSRLMTERILDASEIIDYADNAAGVLATSGGRLNPYKLGVELYRNIEERWDKGQFGKEWEDCDDADAKKNWNLRTGLGRKKLFEVRALYNDVTFIDEFLTPEFCMEQKLFSFDWSNRNERFEIASREFKQVKDKLLFQLTNAGSPFIYVEDGNFENKGELLLRHEHQGMDLRADYAKEVMKSLARVWKRPVNVSTILDGKLTLLRFDGQEHASRPLK